MTHRLIPDTIFLGGEREGDEGRRQQVGCRALQGRQGAVPDPQANVLHTKDGAVHAARDAQVSRGGARRKIR